MTDGSPPKLSWERRVPGRNPGEILIADDRVAVDYVDDQGRPGTPGPLATVCFDFDGKERWRAANSSLVCPLAGNRFFARTDSGEPMVVDADDGRVEGWPNELGLGGRTRAWRDGEYLFLLDQRELVIADANLRPIRRVSLAREGGAIFADGHVFIESDSVVFCDFERTRVLCPVPDDLADEAVAQWRRVNDKRQIPDLVFGRSDSATVVARLKDPSLESQSPRSPQRRLGRPVVDPRSSLIFLMRTRFPHLLACLGFDGNPRWCTLLAGGCCGGAPYRLPDGRYVVSSGCSPFLSWIELDGQVVARSEADEGSDWPLSDRIIVLPDSGCIVKGGSRILSFDSRGRRRWAWRDGGSQIVCDPARDWLFTSGWAGGEGDQCVVSVLGARGLRLDTFVS